MTSCLNHLSFVTKNKIRHMNKQQVAKMNLSNNLEMFLKQARFFLVGMVCCSCLCLLELLSGLCIWGLLTGLYLLELSFGLSLLELLTGLCFLELLTGLSLLFKITLSFLILNIPCTQILPKIKISWISPNLQYLRKSILRNTNSDWNLFFIHKCC